MCAMLHTQCIFHWFTILYSGDYASYYIYYTSDTASYCIYYTGYASYYIY